MAVELKDHLGEGLVTDPPTPGPGDPYDVKVALTDTAHGTRGGGTQHAAATNATAGFATAAHITALEDHEGRIADLEAAGGATIIQIHSPLAKPASPNAKSNYFESSIADFTEFDPDGRITISLDSGRKALKMVGSGNSVERVCGAWKAAPSSNEYIIQTHVSLEWPHESGSPVYEAGLFVGQDLVNNPTTSDLVTLNTRYRNAILGPAVQAYTNHSTWSAYIGQDGNFWLSQYLCIGIRNDSGNWKIAAYVSTDGWSWHELVNFSNLAYQPDSIGLAMSPYSSGTAIARFSYFDVQEGAGVASLGGWTTGRLVGVQV